MSPCHFVRPKGCLAIALMLCLFLLVGCGGSEFPVAPVSGTITLDGQPLADARIGFEPRQIGSNPLSGPGSYAKTDAQGHYVLKTLDGQRGAVVTTHDVWIRTSVAPAQRGLEVFEPAAEQIPPRYNDETTLSFPVPAEGTDQANFALTTESPPDE